jgi:hypothetical protein
MAGHNCWNRKADYLHEAVGRIDERKHFRVGKRGGIAFLALLALFVLAPSEVRADEPLFGFTYTTDTLPKGKFEITQRSTTRFTKYPGGKFWLQENRTEQEWGLRDNLQLALYETYDWTSALHNGPFGVTTPAEQFSYYLPGPDDSFRQGRFVGVSGEVIYRIRSPYTHWLGIALYEEPTFGAGFIESESKLIFQKDFREDRLVVAANLTYAPEFRWVPDESNPSQKVYQEETDGNIDVGVSYRFVPNWSAAFEIFNEREFNSYCRIEKRNRRAARMNTVEISRGTGS